MAHSIVFMGSPEFAVPSLEALAHSYKVLGVVTQPDRRAGRGRTLQAPPVKEAALEIGLPIIQPVHLGRDPEALAQLQAWLPDVIVVVAFGQILRANLLELAQFGCINLHASLLPRWRGAAPINAAILHGDEQSGVSIMKLDEGVDTGPLLSQRAIPIASDEDAAALGHRLAFLGAELLMETLPQYLSGSITPQPQDDSQATYAPMLRKQDGELDFTRPAVELARQVRAFSPWPGAYTYWKDQTLKVHRAHVHTGSSQTPGQRSECDGLPAIATAEGLLVLDELQPAGKKPMPGEVFLRGARDWKG